MGFAASLLVFLFLLFGILIRKGDVAISRNNSDTCFYAVVGIIACATFAVPPMIVVYRLTHADIVKMEAWKAELSSGDKAAQASAAAYAGGNDMSDASRKPCADDNSVRGAGAAPATRRMALVGRGDGRAAGTSGADSSGVLLEERDAGGGRRRAAQAGAAEGRGIRGPEKLSRRW